jgi:hypothetical protein
VGTSWYSRPAMVLIVMPGSEIEPMCLPTNTTDGSSVDQWNWPLSCFRYVPN